MWMGWLRMEGGCGVSQCGGVVWCLESGILSREGVNCSSIGKGVDKDTRRGGDILLVDCLDDSLPVCVSLGNGVLMNNCSHIEGLNIPAIGFTLAISLLKLLSVMLVETSNADMATCPAASIVPTTVRSGGSSVSTDN